MGCVDGFVLPVPRAHRDRASAEATADPRLAGMDARTVPFGGKRMFRGGFWAFVKP